MPPCLLFSIQRRWARLAVGSLLLRASKRPAIQRYELLHAESHYSYSPHETTPMTPPLVYTRRCTADSGAALRVATWSSAHTATRSIRSAVVSKKTKASPSLLLFASSHPRLDQAKGDFSRSLCLTSPQTREWDPHIWFGMLIEFTLCPSHIASPLIRSWPLVPACNISVVTPCLRITITYILNAT
jgi:hypothetical protein